MMDVFEGSSSPPIHDPVVTDDEALDAVVFGVDARHSPTVTPVFGLIICKLGWSLDPTPGACM